MLPFEVPGKGAWYLEGKAHPAGADGVGDTLGLRIADKRSGKYFYFLAACAWVTDGLKSRLRGAPLVFFDGTVWRDDELIAAGLGNKTGQGMGHIAMSGDQGAIASLAGLDIGRKVFLHINNSNPALLGTSAERKAAEQAALADPLRRNGDRAVNVVPTSGMTALSIGKGITLDTAEEMEATLRHHRRDPLSQPASVPPPAARRQAQQGPSPGLGSQPLLLSEHDPAEGRDGDHALPRPQHADRVAPSHRGS